MLRRRSRQWTKCLAVVPFLAWIGCGGGNSGPIPNNQSSANCTTTIQPLSQPATILFQSNGALDGSDSPIVSNIWSIKSDGSVRIPLTKLAAAASSNPRRSPDGSRIAFDSVRALDGSNALNTNGTS